MKTNELSVLGNPSAAEVKLTLIRNQPLPCREPLKKQKVQAQLGRRLASGRYHPLISGVGDETAAVPLYITSTCGHEERQSHGSKDSTVRLSLVSSRRSAWHCKFNFLSCEMSKTCHIAILQYQSPWISLDGFSMFQYVSVTRPRGCRMWNQSSTAKLVRLAVVFR